MSEGGRAGRVLGGVTCFSFHLLEYVRGVIEARRDEVAIQQGQNIGLVDRYPHLGWEGCGGKRSGGVSFGLKVEQCGRGPWQEENLKFPKTRSDLGGAGG